jgi:DNA-directed RNA polymerase specialized sigma24 family protein
MAIIEAWVEDYLGDYGTESQHLLFQDAAHRIKDLYDQEYPDHPEDRAGMIQDQLFSASEYALGDTLVGRVGEDLKDARRMLAKAKDRARGIAVAAHLDGVPKTRIAEDLQITRATLDKWLGDA